MEKYVITIARQFGSLGRPIAKRMSEILNIQYYDRDIVEKTSQELNVPVSKISEVEESVKNKFFYMKFPLGINTTETQDDLFKTQKMIIQSLAEKESCIVVGRCSDYVLQEYENHLSIYIYAPYQARLKNCIENLNMEEKVARKMIADVDRARDLYHMHYAHYLPSDVNYKSIMIDSSLLGVDGTAKFLADLVKEKFNLE